MLLSSAQKTFEPDGAAGLLVSLQTLARPPVMRRADASRSAGRGPMVPGAGASALSLKRSLKRFLHPLPLARRGAAGPRAPRLQLREVGNREDGPGAAGGCPGQRGGT